MTYTFHIVDVFSSPPIGFIGTAPRFTGLVTSIDVDAAHGAAAKPSGYRDGRR